MNRKDICVAVLSLVTTFGFTAQNLQAQYYEVLRNNLSSTGIQANGNSIPSAISGAGNIVAFQSGASNLVVGDTNQSDDIFIVDVINDTITRITLNAQSNQGDAGSYNPALNSSPGSSDDGRYVVYESDATNLVVGDNNGKRDIFVFDRNTLSTSIVSVNVSDSSSDGNSYNPSISADGRYVIFESDSTDLVTGDTNGKRDIFLRDRTLGTTTRVSLPSSPSVDEGDSDSYSAQISSDGLFVVFASDATNLVTGDVNTFSDVFVRNLGASSTARVSVDDSALEANGPSYSPSISGDGRYVAFVSQADNLISADTNGKIDIFRHDTSTATTQRISIPNSGTQQANGDSDNPTISSDGAYVAFESSATNLVTGDTNNVDDIFVRDVGSSATARVSVKSSGIQASGGGSVLGHISANSRYVGFVSAASDLVVGDTNSKIDVFRVDNECHLGLTLSPATDSDSDGTPNCSDNCGEDANKTEPGTCGCGVADTDSDSDGTADCNDACPNDSSKIAPGDCGCGTADTDGNGNGIGDCTDPTTSTKPAKPSVLVSKKKVVVIAPLQFQNVTYRWKLKHGGKLVKSKKSSKNKLVLKKLGSGKYQISYDVGVVGGSFSKKASRGFKVK